MIDSLNISSRSLFPILEQIETDMSHKVRSMIGSKNLSGILQLSVDPRSYDNAASYFKDAVCVSLLRKLQTPVPGVDRRAAAIEKWFQGEADCYRSNERLSPFLYGGFLQPSEMVIRSYFGRVKKKIEAWIGPTPPSLDKALEIGGFGPGATFSDRGRLTTVPDKITSRPTITRGALWYLLPFSQSYWGRLVAKHHGDVEWCRGNRFTTVPKTGLIDRAIAVEPSINIFFQLAMGRSIRRRLLASTGWDLRRAQPIHREVARQASIDKSFCTIDLSNASDTVSYNLVKLLLPTRWFEELNALRSPSTLLDGSWHRLEKFSSMGNGFTFELETLIFAALSSVLLEDSGRSGRLGQDFFVFGDDIILPDEFYNSARAILNYCGFSLNEKKCFSGPDKFRESCGGDFFEGADVRPLFLQDEINDPWALVPQYNGMRLVLEKLSNLGVPVDIQSGLSGITSVMPLELRCCKGPRELGDSVLHSDESEWKFRWKNGIRYFKGVKAVPSLLRWDHWKPDVVLACALYGTGDGTPEVTPRRRLFAGGIIPRDPLLSYKVGWVPFS